MRNKLQNLFCLTSITPISFRCGLSLLVLGSAIQPAAAASEEILAGAFDAVTGTPFATTMLSLVKSGEQTSQSPEILDARLRQVEALLQNIDQRLALVEARLQQLQIQVVKDENTARITQLQQIQANLIEIVTELKTKPTDRGRRVVLEVKAREQAELLKNSPDLNLWKWSDIDSAQTLRIRFMVYPSFELYTLAIATWMEAIALKSPTNPQETIADSGSFLRAHSDFLNFRSNFRELMQPPVSLAEHLQAAAFCSLDAVDPFSDARDQCVFATMCVDTMNDTYTETDRLTVRMPNTPLGSLCTFSPSQSFGLKGEAELRAKYGSELMASLSAGLDQLARTGSLRKPLTGTFPNFVMSQIFSAPLASPLQAPLHALSGTAPQVYCTRSIKGCSYGLTLSDETSYVITTQVETTRQLVPNERFVSIRHNGNGLCLDVNGLAIRGSGVILNLCRSSVYQTWDQKPAGPGKYTLSVINTNLCATVAPEAPPRSLKTSRQISLQYCDGRVLQQFSATDLQSPDPGPR